MPDPNFFIVGAPKCGTTALYQYLRAHPAIFMPDHKEPHHFARDFTAPRYAACRDRASYLALFDAAGDVPRLGEASVYYLYSTQAAAAIHDFAPNARIIIMLRRPDEMLYSYHAEQVYGGEEDLADFADALAAEADRKQGRRVPPRMTGQREFLYYRELACYSPQVERYLDTFGRAAVRVILFEDFKADTPRVYRETLEFLGVDPDFVPDFRVFNPGKRVRLRLLHDFVQTPPKRGIWLRTAIRRALPLAWRTRAARLLRGLNARVTARPALDVALRADLQAEFAPDIERLGALLGRDLSHWITE